MITALEFKRAKGAYKWLQISPLLTVATLIFFGIFNIGSGILNCDWTDNECNQYASILDAAIPVLISALWHLILLQYVNDENSEYVRKHGMRALKQAGIRTAVALVGMELSAYLGFWVAFAFLTILILISIWFYNNFEIKGISDAQNRALLEGTEEADRFYENLSSPEERTAPLSQTEKKTPPYSSSYEKTLNTIYGNLRSADDADILSALDSLSEISYSSEAIRNRLEHLALKSANEEIRQKSFNALNSAANRAVQNARSETLKRGIRLILLREIDKWTKADLLDSANAAVIRRRYDFDIVPPSAPQTPPAPRPAPTMTTSPPTPAPQPVVPPAPPQPRPSLLQTLTSEGAIKIYLYLGAFFVIAAAAIFGFFIEALRVPILLLGTLIFGGAAVGIKKRLPQPSFSLFIVFSFLMVITANVLEKTVRSSLNLSSDFTNAYWVAGFLFMALVWSGGVWFYESRFFSITAFGALTLSALRLGNLIDITEVYPLLFSLVAFVGLAGTWLLRKWKDFKFAESLFYAAQVVQFFNLLFSFISFFIYPENDLFYLFSLTTWILGTLFYLASDWTQPSVLFALAAAGALIPMPWFLKSAFNMEEMGTSIVLFVWGAFFSVVSEALARFDKVKKYSLPVLLSALPNLLLSVAFGFAHQTWLGMILSFAIFFLMTTLHLVRNRWALWAWALIHFIVAYFAFFQLEAIKGLHIFFGYPLVGIAILFLLSDLFLKKDWSANLRWRLAPRLFGAAFLAASSFYLLRPANSGHVAALYFVLALFVAVYALAYRKPYLGYLPALYFALTVVFALRALGVDAWLAEHKIYLTTWLPVITALSVGYYALGAILHKRKSWSQVLRYSGLLVGSFMSVAALFTFKDIGGGWYALIVGLLFIAEMYLSRNGLFEVGAPLLFTLGAFLILRGFKVDEIPYHLLAYSSIWLLDDLLAHLTFAHPRPLKFPVRILGAALAAINFIFLSAAANSWIPAIGFGVYALFAAAFCFVYRQPKALYAFTLSASFFAAFLFRAFGVYQWIYPVIFTAMGYYVIGAGLRAFNRFEGWDKPLLRSGLAFGVIVSVSAFFFGGWGAAIPVAIAASFWAFEAYFKRDVRLSFPANILYLLAYLIILRSMHVTEPQFFSVGAALFGLIQHYLLTRAGSKKGAYIMGMLSQFILLGTTYIEMINKNDVNYFFLLFVQSLVVLIYGIVIRSRSLTFFPIGFVVLGVITVTYSALKGIGSIILIGCTGVLLLLFGIGATLLRERIKKISEKFSGWEA